MPPSTPHTQASPLRAALERIVFFGLFLLLCQTWLIDGFLRPYTIAGASMACTLLGEHRQAVCGDCGYAFCCDSSYRPVSPRAICPNCGYAENDLEPLPDLSGDRVLIDRSAFVFRSPRRWEVIAFRPPRQSEKLAVKRVVGLPGETVEIRHGDVYIDGHIARKPLALQRAMAIPVNDANFVPHKQSLPPRWGYGIGFGKGDKGIYYRGKGERNNNSEPNTVPFPTIDAPVPFSNSSAIIGHPKIAIFHAIDASVDWLVYRHSRRLAGSPGHTEIVPVEDTLTYNQNRPRRVEDVHAVCDLLLSFKLAKTTEKGKIFVRATDGQKIFHAVLDFEKNSLAVFRNNNPLEIIENNIPFSAGMRIEVSLFDRQFLLAFDGRQVLAAPLTDDIKELPSNAEPFALGTQGLEAVVEDLRIYRDVYYTEPIGQNPWGWGGVPVVLGDDEYYVLGDNSSISEDSRTWGQGSPVLSKSLLGKPLAVINPARTLTLFGCQFQIPDLGRIRYIR